MKRALCVLLMLLSVTFTGVNVKAGSFENTNKGSLYANSVEKQFTLTDTDLELYDDFYYSINDNNTISIEGYRSSTENLFIPREINGYVVKRISPCAFSGMGFLKSVTIPDSVTTIDYSAFLGCDNLEVITIPDSVVHIGKNAFDHTAWYDNQLDGLVYAGNVVYKYKGDCVESVTLKNGTLGIAELAFEDCSNLSNITIPDSVINVGVGAFDNTAWYDNQPDGLIYVGKVAYKVKGKCPDSIIFEKDTIAITDCLLENNDTVKNVEIPDSVIDVGEYAFAYCKSLENISFGSGIIEVNYDTLCGSKNLKTITLGESISYIDNKYWSEWRYCLNSLESLESIYVADGNDIFVDSNGVLFDLSTGELLCYPLGNKSKVFDVPEKVTTLPNIQHHILSVINISSTVTSIGEISNSENLESINVAEGNPVYYSIDGILFSRVTNEMLIYPKGNTTQTLTIPEGVEKLCGIDSTELKTLNLSSTVIDFGDLNCDNLETINVNQNSNTYCSVDGVLYNKSLTEMLYYPWGNAMTDYHIPDTVVTLRGELGGTSHSGNNRFGHGTKYLKNIYVPESVTDFGRYSFTLCGDCIENIFVDKNNPVYYSENGIMYKGSSVAAYPQNNKTKDFHIPEGTNGVPGTFYLSGCRYVENVYMPASLTKFSFGLFEFCESLKNIYVDENNPDFCDINGILYNKQKTRLVCYPHGKENAVVVLPDGTKELESCSFYKCNQITGLVIPQSMRELNGGAFIQCENLRDFTFTKDIQSISGIGYVLGGGPGAGGWKIGDIENVTIRGYSGTVAESYARDNGFTFISLGKVDRLLGDTDADGSVTIVDATVIQRHLAEIPTAVYIEAAADADQDGQVTILDATAIQRWLAELPVYEGIGKVFV